MIKPYTDQHETGGQGFCYIAEEILHSTYTGGFPYGHNRSLWAITTVATKQRIKIVDTLIDNNIRWVKQDEY